MGDPSIECDFLEISPKSLEKLYHTLRFRNDYSSFYTTRLFHCSYHSHYDIDADPSGPPTSISKSASLLMNSLSPFTRSLF
jgi:hypothetical protein